MTFVGKILVIVIMAFALLFLGISTVVFTTHTNWKEAIDKTWKPKVADLQKKNTDFQAQVDAAKKDLEKAQAEYKAVLAKNENRIASLEDAIKQTTGEMTAARAELEKAAQSSERALAEAEERRNETDRLREQKSAVEKQANDYKLQQLELNDKIRELERMNKTLDANTKDLRDRVAKLSTLLRLHGLPDDVRTVKGQESPPVVEGVVERVDAQNRNVEISIGSDDGLLNGHVLVLYRLKPLPEYLGKIEVINVDPDRAVGRVVGTTVQGKEIKEGDIVSSTIRPRS